MPEYAKIHQHIKVVDPTDTFYTKNVWKSFSRRYKDKNPLCLVSQEAGRPELCQVLDHIIPIKQGGAKWDVNNLCPMTHYWHNLKRNLESRQIYFEHEYNDKGDKIPKGGVKMFTKWLPQNLREVYCARVQNSKGV